MIKIPFLNRYITDDPKFYDVQINEELKYCNCSDFVIRFTELGKNKRAFIINAKEQQPIVLVFMKYDYKGINETLEILRLNIALLEKENSLNSSNNSIRLATSSKNEVSVNGNSEDKRAVTISTIDQLLINNNALREKDFIIRRLFDLAMQNDRKEPYLDFYKAGYDAGIQNYLIMNLYQENIDLNDNIVFALLCYKMKEPKFYYLINSLLRGNFDEMFDYLKSIKQPVSVGTIAKIAQNIIQAQEELPNRTCDLMIYRAGLGINKDKSIGGQNLYESFVSFGTSGGTLEEQPSDNIKPIVYKRILKKDEKAIPVDLIENLGLIYVDGTQENEFLLPPFAFEITEISEEKPFNTYSIEETRKINPREILDRRLDELEQYLKSKNDLTQYEKLRKSRDKITSKSKKIIKMQNIKDIYYGLRPKRKKSKELKEDFGER